MTSGANLVIPLVLWGKTPPTHCVSCVYLCDDRQTLVTGCYDGQICLWHVDSDTMNVIPRNLTVGHTAPILCLCEPPESGFFISSSENGEMCSWDTVDGRCREVAKLPYVHTYMQPYKSTPESHILLFCTGYYAEVLVIDPITFETLYSLNSQMSPDWIAALHVLRPHKRKDDVVLGVTVSGVVKMWTLTGNETKLEPIHEQESKQIKCINGNTLICCAHNQRTVLIVTPKCWQIYDAGDFSVLCSVASARGERWIGGHFLSPERIIVWSDSGKAYMYHLPANSIAGNSEFHSSSTKDDNPILYSILEVPDRKPLSCAPAMRFFENSPKGPILIRADSEGSIKMWQVPHVEDVKSKIDNPIIINPFINSSLAECWAAIKPPPVGILDQLEESNVKLTASIFLPSQGRLVVGREDGSIVIVPAIQTVMLQLLHGPHQQYDDWPPHQMLHGHSGRVNCLLYPNHSHPRYDKSHLVSGAVDFAVCLWDLYAGTLLNRFCVHAGEIQQLLVPPNNTSARVQKCVCSVASDHSVTLLSLTERKCIVLASRHLFPVVTIKWRPLDDFMMVACSDATVYVWQMETGHLDRVLHGLCAEEVLSACDEDGNRDGHSLSDVTSEGAGLANPAVHFFRGLRHRNLAAVRAATARGLHHLQQLGGHSSGSNQSQLANLSAHPLLIHGLKTNPRDSESHVLCFDVEALIVQLLSEEYGAMSPNTLEKNGLISASEYQKVTALTQSASPDAQKKIADFFGKVKNKAADMERTLKEKDKHGFLAKMKEGAENVQTKLQAKAESVGLRPLATDKPSGVETGTGKIKVIEANLTMELGRLLLSVLHGWSLDNDLDRLCETRLGLLRPMVALCFGTLSRGGHMSLILPTYHLTLKNMVERCEAVQAAGNLPKEMILREAAAQLFTSVTHWKLSSALTTTHLLTIVALSNTLMSMGDASFVQEQERRKIINTPKEEIVHAQTKQGWSLVATLHCVLLPDKVPGGGVKRAQVEMLAGRWQHRCIEVREAAQALLLAELRRIGVKGRRALVDYWLPHLPGEGGGSSPQVQSGGGWHEGLIASEHHEDLDELEDNTDDPWGDARKRQTTAVVLLGVIGSEDFGNGSDENGRRLSTVSNTDDGGFRRQTAIALSYLLLAPPSMKLPPHASLRRAAVDLLGRGFTIWQPYLDVTKVLLGLLELSCGADKLVPSMTFGLPLTTAADCCRSARHSLTLIATARPAAFITTMAKEVARYNNLQQNQQALNLSLHNNVLFRAKPEILRTVELLIDKMHAEISDLLVEVMDIILHCVEPGHLKIKTLNEVFPAICRFNQVSHCPASRRIAVGAKNGTIALYELRNTKCQMIQAHESPVTANSFSPDGKFLASYSCGENKLSFWQTSQGIFGLGTSQTKRTKSYDTQPVGDISRLNPMRLARLVWINNKTVTLLLADGSEARYNV